MIVETNDSLLRYSIIDYDSLIRHSRAHLQHLALNRNQQLANGERRKVAIDHHAVRIGQPRVRKLLQQRLFRAEPVKAEIHAGADLGQDAGESSHSKHVSKIHENIHTKTKMKCFRVHLVYRS
jgi:hypothetical protein